jgi:protoporphyrinogen oxidase
MGPHALIVGAGASGLSAAYHLLLNRWRVTLFERQSRPGGLASSTSVGGATVERFYHHIFVGQDDIIRMANELGMGHDVIWRETKMGFFTGDELYPFNGPLDLLRFRPLPWASRIRLGLSLMWLGRLDAWEPLDPLTAKSLLLRYSGRPAWDVVWQPLMKVKFGELADNISAAWLWERVHSRQQSQRLGKGKESLGYVRGGSGRLLEVLAERVQTMGGVLETGCSADELLIAEDTCKGLVIGRAPWAADAVIMTAPIPTFVRLAPSLPEVYQRQLQQIHYQGALCVLVRLRRSLSPYYWINVADARKAFGVVIEHTHLAPVTDYGGESLVYLGSYLPPDHPWMSAAETQVADRYLADLRAMFPAMAPDNILGWSLARERYAQPVFHQGFSKVRPGIATPINRLYLTTTAQSYPESRSVNTALKLGRQAAQLALEQTEVTNR